MIDVTAMTSLNNDFISDDVVDDLINNDVMMTVVRVLSSSAEHLHRTSLTIELYVL